MLFTKLFVKYWNIWRYWNSYIRAKFCRFLIEIPLVDKYYSLWYNIMWSGKFQGIKRITKWLYRNKTTQYFTMFMFKNYHYKHFMYLYFLLLMYKCWYETAIERITAFWEQDCEIVPARRIANHPRKSC